MSSIRELMALAMADIGAVAKTDRNAQQNFNFRGIDAVVNAVGPVLRKHGIVMLPEAGEPTIDHYQSRGGAQMTHVLLPVEYRFYGPDPDEDPLLCRVVGEASDAGDKVMSKAHSVAWRVALLQCFAIPTDDPDPDAESHERAPGVDWPSLGWVDQAQHDAARSELGDRSKALHPDDQAELKAWLVAQGWRLPYTGSQMGEWAAEIDRLSSDAEAPLASRPVVDTEPL